MASTTFADRVARIEKRQPAPEFNPRRFAEPARAKPVRRKLQARSAGRNLGSMAIGTVVGALMGVLVQGAVMAGSPWGPGTEYGELLGLLGLAGLLASLPLVLLSTSLRRRAPGFFFFSAAYAISVITVVML